MINAADNFKKNVNKLTEYRIRSVMKYIIYCYQKTLADNKKYDYSKRGKIAQEDYIRNGLINDYLSKSYNKKYFKENISDNPFVDITFHPEETKTYIDSVTKEERNDKIDISIYESGIQELWSKKTDDEITFAVECKRFISNDDCKEYIKDIKKFTERYQTTFRLPIEGQMAFIENSLLTHSLVVEDINKKLESNPSISTLDYLKSHQISDLFDGSYKSKHRKNFNDREPFKIYHLFLDYSSIIMN
ncbi:hypothetical protein [Pedobacter arcticus]|uniref:hypothetical protein n=1 Tax=Pedobacter arcticus TaxID=752140 RepID=UPI0002D848FE|nr:hypothetical protein [Pedobacter arcticus]